jgi:hypothetical protein
MQKGLVCQFIWIISDSTQQIWIKFGNEVYIKWENFILTLMSSILCYMQILSSLQDKVAKIDEVWLNFMQSKVDTPPIRTKIEFIHQILVLAAQYQISSKSDK